LLLKCGGKPVYNPPKKPIMPGLRLANKVAIITGAGR
jgi:hypothetical protein